MNTVILKLLQTMLLLLFYLQLQLLVFHSWSAVGTEVRCLERERQALLDLKAGFVDDSGLLSSWGNEEEKRDCCRWERVRCSNQTGHVQMLHLQGEEYLDSYSFVDERAILKGKISTSLMELQHLRYLNLSFNDFEYSYIPDFFGSLRNLRSLDVSGSYFAGKIPDQLGSLLHLRHLDLSYNFLEGGIPSQFGNLSQLQYLNVRANNLIGAIPYQLGNLSSLQKLYLGYNQALTIDKKNYDNTQWLSNLTSLTVLDLSWVLYLNHYVNLQQSISKLQNLSELFLGLFVDWLDPSEHNLIFLDPSNFNFSSSLTILDLSNINLPTRFLKSLGNICTLRTLILYGVNMSEDISIILHNLSGCASYTLKELYLGENQITGVLRDLSRFPSLEILEVYSNSIELGILESSKKTCSLRSLDVSRNSLRNEFLDIIHNLSGCRSTLKELYLDVNRITGVLRDLSRFPYLKSLYLYGNQLNGIAEGVELPSKLEILDVSSNSLEDGIPESFGKICSIHSLDLTNNSFHDELSKIIHNLFGCRSTLQELRLGQNQITGVLIDLSNFSSLKVLYLNENQLYGIAEGVTLPSKLEILDISSNSLKEGIIESIGKICSLHYLRLYNISLSNELPIIIHNLLRCARSLQFLDLSSNHIKGTIPNLSKFSSLKGLYLSDNHLKSVLTNSNFANMSKLKYLDLSFNSLTLTLSPNWVPSFQLKGLYLQSCNEIGPKFPQWLQTQKTLSALDISDSKISDRVPEWFWYLSPRLSYINISYNNLTGTIPNFSTRYMPYTRMNLASNQFEGSIPQFFRSATYLDLSRNKFSSLGMFACANGSTDTLGILDISNNQLSGQLPNCWNNFKSLAYLDMSNNNLSKKIPNSIGSLVELKVLVLRNNTLRGDLPTSLKNCTKLVMLDVEENRFSGKIPSWIGIAFKQLRMLSLRFNHFSGNIPLDLCHLTSLQFLDLSLNSLTGEIHQCLKNLTAMSQKEENLIKTNYYLARIEGGYAEVPFDLNAFLMWKGVEQKFKNTAFRLRSIDLSSNQLMGEIPTQITNLDKLVSLNLSRNHLKGEIPSEIGRLTSLDFLDLSRNQLCGKIPSSLAQIDRLTMLNLSHNQLSGRIPTSTQLQSFDASSFEENLDLCGKPLEKECPEEKATQRPPEVEDKEDSIFSHPFYMSMALGFITGFWGIFGSIVVNRSWRYAYFRFLNNLTDAIFVMVAINVTKYCKWLNH